MGSLQKWMVPSYQTATTGVTCGRPSLRTVESQKRSAVSRTRRVCSHDVTTPSGSLYRMSSVVMGSFITRTPFNRSVSPSRRGEYTSPFSLREEKLEGSKTTRCLQRWKESLQTGSGCSNLHRCRLRKPPSFMRGRNEPSFWGVMGRRVWETLWVSSPLLTILLKSVILQS